MNRVLKYSLLSLLVLILIFIGYFFIGSPPRAKEISWGVNFSQKQAQNLGLNWKEAYLALLEDLGVKKIKIATYWDLLEPEEGQYNFTDLDWQIEKAQEKGTEILLVIGMKTPRWPECHEPGWAQNQKSNIKNQNLLKYIEIIVNRYKNSPAIRAWQVENEPFFAFGECPKLDKDLLKKEIDLVRSLDNRPIIISDTGEWSFWFKAAKYGDIVGTTMYKRLWFKPFNSYINYHFPSVFYYKRAKIIKQFFDKEVICVELQAEPWGPVLLYYLPLEEQKKSMDFKQFRENIEFAKKTGLKEFYLWGGEWWYWLKEKQNSPEIWNEAKKLF